MAERMCFAEVYLVTVFLLKLCYRKFVNPLLAYCFYRSLNMIAFIFLFLQQIEINV